MFKALSEGHRAFTRIAIVADTDAPTPPCGACRQILWEFGGNLEILLANLTEDKGTHQLKDLLPLPFDARLLVAFDEFEVQVLRFEPGTLELNLEPVQSPMLPTIAREGDVVVMIDQRKLPGAGSLRPLQDRRRSRARDQDDGDPRRAGDRRRGGDGHRARHAPAARRPARRSSPPSSTRSAS